MMVGVPAIRRRRKPTLRAVQTAVVALAAGGVAQAAEDSAIDGNPQAPEFHFAAGPGIYSYPLYPGARGARNLLFPFIDAEYANRFYTSASDLFGVYGYKTDATQVGAALEYDPTRRQVAGDPHLAGLPDVRQTSRLKLFGSHTLGFVTGDMNVARDVEGRKQGTLGQANLWLTAPFDPTFSLSIGPGMTWADSRYMQTFYTVPAAAESVSGLPAFASHAGIVDAHWNGLAEWQLFGKYRLGASASFAHLQGDAANSPITLRHEQATLTGWLAYRFN